MHTKGSWIAVDISNNKRGWRIRRDAPVTAAGDIAHVYMKGDTCLGPDNGEGEANTKLLAASLDLLEGCQDAMVILRSIRDEHPLLWDTIVTPEICGKWDKIKAAISKVA